MILFHTLLGTIALLTGLAVLLLPKGTRLHRRIGLVYGLSMAVLCIGSFWIQNLFDGLGMFHVMALVSLVTVGAGIFAVLRRPRAQGWYLSHMYFMLWSYVGLVMALGSHFFRPLALTIHGWSGSAWMAYVGTGLLVWGLPALLGNLMIPPVARRHAGTFEATTPA